MEQVSAHSIIKKEEINKYKFLRDWKSFMNNTMEKLYPGMLEEDITEVLDDLIQKKLVIPKCELHNNYEHRKLETDLLTIIDWMDQVKPIIAGFGCFFMNQDQIVSPTSIMLDKFLKLRKKYKAVLKDLQDGTDEYYMQDLKQLTEKINANSFYGAGGAPTSTFFNLFTASSITATGQSLISTTETAFEYFMVNNCPFIDLDECMHFIMCVLGEENKSFGIILPKISVFQMFTRIKSMFKNWHDSYEVRLMQLLGNLNPAQISRLYYKNNLYEFCRLDGVKPILVRIFEKVELFRDPNEVPECISDDVELLWQYFHEFVAYEYFAFDRIERLKHDKRKATTTIDTDSNMISLLPWIEFLTEEIIAPSPVARVKDVNEMIFAGVNTMAYTLTKYITNVLEKYTKNSNLLPRESGRINMKNEFLFKTQILASVKKRYITKVQLREGVLMTKKTEDTKGFDFKKSSTSDETKEFCESLVKRRLLDVDDIEIPPIMYELSDFKHSIVDSLKKGEKKYLTPVNAKEIEAYKNPYSMQAVLSVFAWNAAYPDQEIQLPEKLMVVKVNLQTEDKLLAIKDTYPEIYKNLLYGIFKNPLEEVRKKGVYCIAIPTNVKEVPEWITPFIDTKDISDKIMNKIYPLLESLGLKVFKTSGVIHHTNIIEF